MTLTQLRYFLAIVRAGSMSAAAQQVHVAQPAVSQQIKQLEGELGQSLFRRHARGIVLTDAGLRLRDHAIDILRRVDNVHDEFVSTRAAPVGTVALGLASALNTGFSMAIYTEVQRRHPAIRLRLIEGMSGHLLEWVHEGRVDLATVYDAASQQPADREPALQVDVLGREALFLIAAPGSAPAAGARPISLAQLARLPMILPGFPHSLRILLDRRFSATPYTLDTVAEVDSTLTIKQLVGAGHGYSILSWHAVREDVERGVLVARAIARPGITRSIDLIAGRHRAADPAVAAVRELAGACIRSGLLA
jgi:LysR family nitrogen assimilation transcriptional regulator